MVRKLGRVPARVLPHRSGLATASSAAVPPCMLAGVLRSSSGRSKGTLGCTSRRGARWCSPRGRRPRRRQDPAGRSWPEYGVADPWGDDPWVPPVSASAGVGLGGSSVFRRFYLNKGFQNLFKSCIFHNLSSIAPKLMN